MNDNGSTLNVYDRIRAKLNNSEPLSIEEREKLEDILLDNYDEWLYGATDEDLKTEANETGVL